jgi:hypothetical protein
MNFTEMAANVHVFIAGLELEIPMYKVVTVVFA